MLSCLTGLAAEYPQIKALPQDSVSARSAVENIRPYAAFQQSLEYVIPELILGGEWTSVIKLTNRSNIAIPPTNVYFLDNSGNPMTTTFQTTAGNPTTDVGFSFWLPPGAVLEGTFLGTATTVFGHALVATCSASGVCLSGLYAEVTLKNTNSTRPDFESVFPIEQPTALQYMLWDHRSGVITVLYLVNENTSTTTVSLDFTDTANQEIQTVTITMASLSSQILTLNTLAPQTNGIQGTLTITGQNASSIALITATGLRINPTNSFTPMRAFVPKL